jgi:transcriptional regulator with XRE-family HTH domain
MADEEAAEGDDAALAFGQSLRETLRTKGVSRAELARRVKVSPNAVSGWTTGSSTPDYKNLIRIIQALDADPADLLDGSTSTPQSTSPSDQLILRLARLQLTGRVQDLRVIGNSVLATLEQIDQRAAEIQNDRGSGSDSSGKASTG